MVKINSNKKIKKNLNEMNEKRQINYNLLNLDKFEDTEFDINHKSSLTSPKICYGFRTFKNKKNNIKNIKNT